MHRNRQPGISALSVSISGVVASPSKYRYHHLVGQNFLEAPPEFCLRKISPRERRQKRAILVTALGPLKKRHSELETQISQLETSQELLESKMADPAFFKTSDAREAMVAHERDQIALEKNYEEWSRLSDRIAAKEQELDELG